MCQTTVRQVGYFCSSGERKVTATMQETELNPKWSSGKESSFTPSDKMSNPTTVRHDAATIETSANAYTNLETSNSYWIFFGPLSIKGGNAAAPAARNGLVMLFPVHKKITI
ncbi:hypothetical protein JRO89_XS04G0048000 [Xanthoceras sorbifolium]|uniref:Uncharacterized protein n=1 Tax=Xanthoceras sorbifolium TaxID=99658 RepID=A0ABQ8I454_9ROSI|nr:hypothetical protein JRO89_XS04G0048000 [Xanthoceras sorbifolium]